MLTPHLHSQGKEHYARTRDGRSLFYQELSGPLDSSAPTVVFESGLAASRSFWGLVQPATAQFTKAVVYDRSGLGRSEYRPMPRSMENMASDLNDLLDQIGPGPFILVAHSGGGPIIREATAARPERIAGLVLIDAPDEGCLALFDKTFLLLEKVAHAASCALARVGLLSLFYRRLMAPLPREVRHDLRREGFTQKAMATRGAELKGLRNALNKYRYQAPILPNNPVTLISGAKADFGMSKRLRSAANAAHMLRAKLLHHGRHVLAKKSGHCVLLTEPDLIVNEIYKIIREQEYR